MTGEFYAENGLRDVEKLYKKRRSGIGARGIKLLHANARPYIVRETIEDSGFEVTDHPLYSLDLYLRFLVIERAQKNISGDGISIREK